MRFGWQLCITKRLLLYLIDTPHLKFKRYIYFFLNIVWHLSFYEMVFLLFTHINKHTFALKSQIKNRYNIIAKLLVADGKRENLIHRKNNSENPVYSLLALILSWKLHCVTTLMGFKRFFYTSLLLNVNSLNPKQRKVRVFFFFDISSTNCILIKLDSDDGRRNFLLYDP